MNPERLPFKSIEDKELESSVEDDQRIQRFVTIVDSAVNTLPICNQLGPEEITTFKTSIIDAFVGLDYDYSGRWRNLSVISDFIDTTNNHILIVAANDPSQVVLDLEEISQQEALSGIRNKRRHVKKAFERTLNMLKTNTTTYEDSTGFKNKGKDSEFFGQIKRPSSWRIMYP